jgi:hypothetical protein
MPTEEKPKTRAVLWVLIILLLVLVIGWHLILPILGVAVVLSAAAWGVIVLTIAGFSLAALLFFLLPWVLILVLCVIGFIWLIIALALFPFLFPLLIPIFIILLFIAYLRRRRKQP